MRHLIVADYGTFVGLRSERVVVRSEGEKINEVPLRDLRTIKVAKPGVTISSDLILECSIRGIKISFTNFKGEVVGLLSGGAEHAVVKVRMAQLSMVESVTARRLAAKMLFCKLRNQRAVLLYFNKYRKKMAPEAAVKVSEVAKDLLGLSESINCLDLEVSDWRNRIMGLEGAAAARYFSAWPFLGIPLRKRIGRGADDPVNSALNYGYAILQSHVWSAVVNAGLEPYAGFLHVDRPGKPALVLDIMEEYRPWVVDRCIMKLTSNATSLEFDKHLRRRVVEEIERTLASKLVFLGKRLRLDTIIQRRAYRMAGALMSRSRYPPFLVKW